MKSVGVKIKGKDCGEMFFLSNNKKAICKTQEFTLFGGVDEYVPYLRKDGVDLPINYKRIISEINKTYTNISEFHLGKKILENEYKEDGFKIIYFIIEEI